MAGVPSSNPIAQLMRVQPSPETSVAETQQSVKARKPPWRIVLGRAAWSRYTYERPEGDDLTLLVSVNKGAQVGALAVTTEGAYVQVVGDYLVPLKTKEIAKAVANAPKEPNPVMSGETPSWLASRKEASAPVVIVKKRRVAVLP